MFNGVNKKLIAILAVAVVAFTAATAFAGKDYNSSISNSSSIAAVNKQVEDILLRYGVVSQGNRQKVTDALANGIAEEKLKVLLVEIGVAKESAANMFAEFEKLGIASESAEAVPSVISPTPLPTNIAPKPAITPEPIPPTTQTPTAVSGTAGTVNVSPIKKCGVNTYRVGNQCGNNAFKEAYVQCYDGYEENLGGENLCKPSDIWKKYVQEVCANRCSAAGIPQPVTGPKPKPAPMPAPTPKPTEIKKLIAICYIPDKLTKDYNQLILDLRKAENVGDKETAELVIKKITALKLEIERARKECLANTTVQPQIIQSPTEARRPLAPVAIDRCAEVAQWENKIAYYQNLVGLSDAELKEQTGFSREEVERILAELPRGLVKVKAQCDDQQTVGARPIAAVKQIIAEPVKPVAVESGQEITDYYKARIEKITASEDTEAQIENLKSLKGEIDELIAKLIKGRKEIESSELGNVVSEIRVSRGEIKVDDVTVKTTDKKILLNVGAKPVSVVPAARQVEIIEIKDGDDLEVTAREVSIKDNLLTVGGVEVKLRASEVAENLNVVPKAAELEKENDRAVYKLKVKEQRKLFGFIPIRITKTLTADAESSDLLDERLPWYSFLTTR